MKRYAMTVLLRDGADVIRRYEEMHAHPWPEVVRSAEAVGVRRTFIFRHGRQLFMFMEAEDHFDPQRDLPRRESDPRVREWEELMRSLQQPVPGAPPEGTWVEMKEIFRFESSRK